jgi:hypothetical protein
LQSSDRWFRLHTPPPLNVLLAPNGNGVADLDTFETNAPLMGDASVSPQPRSVL